MPEAETDARSGILIVAADPSQRTHATRLARRFNLPRGETVDSTQVALIWRDGGLELDQGQFGRRPLRVDFVAGTLGHRWRFGGGAGRQLSGAIGLRRGRRPAVVDATGGFGQDAFLLAALGCQVTVIERSAVMAALLDDGLRRGRCSRVAEVVARIRLVHADARAFLASCQEAQPVVYLDPMFPPRLGSARPAISMLALRAVVGDDEDAPELLELALATARRIVVKRPAGASALGDRKPDFHTGARTARFDVYLNSGAATGLSGGRR